MQKIRNIIFDLGGVILNLDSGAIERHFQQLLARDYYLLFRELQTQDVFNKFEVGAFSEQEFLNYFLERTTLTQEQVINGWNKILLDVPKERLDLLRHLKSKYQLYLLSNTNYTHVQKIESDLKIIHGVQNFRKEFFEVGYYSYEMGMRKPEQRIFKEVLADAGLKADETLFIDDNKNNIKSAKKCGIQTILHEANSDLKQSFATNGILF